MGIARFISRVLKIEPGITVGQWAYDRIANNWGWIVALFGSGGMTYLATITEWLKPWGPIAYGAIALSTVIIGGLVYALVGTVRAKLMLVQIYDRTSKSSNINVLLDKFERTKIRVADFFHPYGKIIENVKFQDCEIYGPTPMFVLYCTFQDGSFTNCDVVILDSGVNMTGAVAFKQCIFERSHFYNVTLFVTRGMYDDMVRQLGSPLNVISGMSGGQLPGLAPPGGAVVSKPA